MKLLSFNEFSDYIKQQLSERMECIGQNCEIYIQKITKNNGVVLTALQILEEGSNCTPSIYLEPYYRKYQENVSIEELITEMEQFYDTHKDEMNLPMEDILSFENKKSRIIMRLVN